MSNINDLFPILTESVRFSKYASSLLQTSLKLGRSWGFSYQHWRNISYLVEKRTKLLKKTQNREISDVLMRRGRYVPENIQHCKKVGHAGDLPSHLIKLYSVTSCFTTLFL